MKAAFTRNVWVTNSWMKTCTLTVTCSNVGTEIHFGYVLQFPTFATLSLTCYVSFPDNSRSSWAQQDKPYPIRWANKTFRKGQGAGRGLQWILSSSLSYHNKATDPASGVEILTTLFNIFVNQLSSRADSVVLVLPLIKRTVVTKKQRTPNTNFVTLLYRPGRSFYNWDQCSALQSIHGCGPEVGGGRCLQHPGQVSPPRPLSLLPAGHPPWVQQWPSLQV